jgi:hypothetical protein
MDGLTRPIGIFDSGVGGLTVLKALRRKLPHRDFIYLGDTARVPYGRKPAAMVAEFAYGITEFLRGMGVEGVVIACNTASASALPELSGYFAIPIWGVIEPGVEAAASLTRTGRVGVIGTKGTIASGAYQRRLEQRGLSVWARLPYAGPHRRGRAGRVARMRSIAAPLSGHARRNRYTHPGMHTLPAVARCHTARGGRCRDAGG